MTDATSRDALDIPGVLLAGGLARRMGGGDKPMRTIAGRTILDRVIARLAPQCDGLILNANGDPARFAAFGLPVIADGVADFPGPLAGILAALDWAAANRPDVAFVLSAAADCPFLPRDLMSRLHDALEAVESVALPKAELRTSWLYQMTHAINTMPSLYLEAGAIHGCVLCKEGTPVCYTEDVGRHNAVDKIAGWIYRHGVDPADKILYTTGRLTSEMVIKTVRMGIPILVSRSGFTAWGVELARQVGLTLVGRTRGKRFIALSGQERIVFDQNLDYVEEESARHKRKGESDD
jgi:molybdenum cofactor guanylyltransferase